MSAREWALEGLIHASPATTIAGLAVKARIVAHEFDLEELDVASVERGKTLAAQHYCQTHAALSLALDILRMVRLA